ncbi:conserved hypothetical protein [Xenorhabdus bovienii str. kraussei Becker Underwood]|uniref:Uncharacterized protein n=1 Tax=Xenorhabdus bovienii str. kraussei Becker Underwood TaxID=1398204 RepID=A0A077PW52_XENBV|nr:conserved hypothetical protein [Xenorhabdus bovienii str. kraussei Becker Underwood]
MSVSIIYFNNNLYIEYTTHEARHHAVKALKKMEEPKTETEIQALIERTWQTMNESNTENAPLLIE